MIKSSKFDKENTTILLNVYNAQKHIDTFFDSLINQTYKDYKILVIDDGSIDNTILKIQNYKKKFQIEIIKKTHQGLRKARRYGINKIKTNIIIILDIDLILDKNAINELIKSIKNKKNIAAVGGILKGKGNTKAAIAYAELRNIFYRLRENKSQADWLSGGFCAFKKDAIQKTDGFSEEITSADIDISWKLKKQGYQLIINKRAIAYHKDPENLKEIWQRELNIGKREFFLTKKYPKQALKPRRILRFYPIITPFLFLLLIFFWPIFITIIILSFIATVLIIKNRLTIRAYSWIVFHIMNFAYCSGFIVALIKK